MDEVIINKTAVIEKCLERIREMYIGYEKEFDIDFMRQDAIILNLQRACEAAIDLGMFIVKIKKLGIPQSTRDVFEFLMEKKILPIELCQSLQAMVGFRNIAVHDYQKINLAIIHSILENRLIDFEQLVKTARNLND